VAEPIEHHEIGTLNLSSTPRADPFGHRARGGHFSTISASASSVSKSWASSSSVASFVSRLRKRIAAGAEKRGSLRAAVSSASRAASECHVGLGERIPRRLFQVERASNGVLDEIFGVRFRLGDRGRVREDLLLDLRPIDGAEGGVDDGSRRCGDGGRRSGRDGEG